MKAPTMRKRTTIDPVETFCALTLVFISVIVLLLTGCRGKTPSRLIDQYALEYSSPVFAGSPKIQTSIKVGRFSVAHSYNTSAMVYRPEPFKQDTYRYHRWRSNPGDMVSDYLLRDLMNSGLFRGVFSYRGIEETRYALEGGVEEFLEISDDTERKASLALHITLLDLKHFRTSKRILLQKRYHAQEHLNEQTPGGLAQGMSRAMERVSKQIVNDVYNAIKDR